MSGATSLGLFIQLARVDAGPSPPLRLSFGKEREGVISNGSGIFLTSALRRLVTDSTLDKSFIHFEYAENSTDTTEFLKYSNLQLSPHLLRT